jgi:hypothetical protein
MIIRSLEPTDIVLLKEIHEKHWKEEFVLPDFLNKYHCVFTVEDVGGIITIGGVRPIAECVTVTNKDINPKIRLEALFKILDASMFVANTYGYDQLHAFVQDKRWANRLRKHCFKPTRGQSLVLDI